MILTQETTGIQNVLLGMIYLRILFIVMNSATSQMIIIIFFKTKLITQPSNGVHQSYSISVWSGHAWDAPSGQSSWHRRRSHTDIVRCLPHRAYAYDSGKNHLHHDYLRYSLSLRASFMPSSPSEFMESVSLGTHKFDGCRE